MISRREFLITSLLGATGCATKEKSYQTQRSLENTRDATHKLKSSIAQKSYEITEPKKPSFLFKVYDLFYH